ncbi:hypothetical protein MMAN_15680 [Mycobacterium mantenii]|uniref:Uncharacterized protein n=1 Tax=Mycobacterium mantenii TaxID=560555 RepID=A0ABM7JPM0_MYCNT|nr:hypothetical protein MMAN_15680 [Mycobacterium mantenii]
MGATEVTPAAGAIAVRRAEPVARLFAVTLAPPKALSIITISGRDYQRDENLNFSWVFDYAHQSAIAGSFEVSAAPIRCGKGAQDG